MVAAGVGTATAAAPPGAAAAPAVRPLGQVVPVPADVRPAGAPYVLGEHATISVPLGSPQAAQVGDYLADLLRPSTGRALPVTHLPLPGGIALRLGHGDGLGTEGYRLDVRPTGVVIRADAAAGLFHGVQTLRQLLPAAVEARTQQPGPWTVAGGTITDTPRYAYRGAMLDVSRHFFTVAQVERVHRPDVAVQDQLPAPAPDRRPGLADRHRLLAAAGHVRRLAPRSAAARAATTPRRTTGRSCGTRRAAS